MTRIEISLPDDVLEEIDVARKEQGETRSEFMRKAVDAYLKQEERAVAAYASVCRQFSDSEEEMDGIWQVSMEALASIPYEDGVERD